MNWILENLQLVVIVASAFAWWWSQRRGRAGPDSAPPEAERPETTEYEEMERTRRIQEEIRRKIAERNAGGPRVEREPPPVPERDHRPREVVPPPLVETLRRLAPDWVEEDRAAQERQQQLEEQMRALEEQRRAARAAAQQAAAAAAKLHQEPARGGRATPVGQLPLRQALRDPRSLRQAVVLREVLGPPVGLR